jgi:drug/metabolite transporter (DMT)-like permease
VLVDSNNQPPEPSYFGWIHAIFFYKVETEHDEKPQYRIHWKRVNLTIALGIQSVFQRWLFYESYYFATLANMNNGVLMAVYSTKAIFTSILFYTFFHQALKKFEIIGVFMSVICGFLIAFSNTDFSGGDLVSEQSKYSYFAILLCTTSILFL